MAEYAANMKPVIPDYDWIIFGVRVRSRLFLITTGSYSGSGSPEYNGWYKGSYEFSLSLLEKLFLHPGLKVSVVKGSNASFENAERLEEQYSRLYVGFIISYENKINGVSFTKYEVCEFQRWNYEKCRGYLRFVFYFLDAMRTKIKHHGVSLSEEVVDGLMAGKLFPSTVKGMLSDSWYISDLIGDLATKYEIEQNPVEYLNKFKRLISMLGHNAPVNVYHIENTTKDFSYGWVIKYSSEGKSHSEFFHSLSIGLDEIYDRYVRE